VLFSNEQVARFINQNFEPAWEMVRPVPVVRIDFGNGNVVTRTLHGNIASYVCAPDGQVVDIIPGIYNPPSYQAALEPIRRLATDLGRQDRGARQNRLRDYHDREAAQLRIHPAVAAAAAVAESAPLAALAHLGNHPAIAGAAAQNRELPTPTPSYVSKAVLERPLEQTLAGWQALADDSLINERVRRLQIHERLANVSVVPEQIKKWLYKEVLHSDLDDPYLGLGSVLLGDDIFREENS
jgi:hypothetical protein